MAQFRQLLLLSRRRGQDLAPGPGVLSSAGRRPGKITSERENEFVLALARKEAPSVPRIWIGLTGTADDFYWSDYSVPVYTNWAPSEPNGNGNERCSNMWTGFSSPVPLRASGYWNDRNCLADANQPGPGFVCKALP